MALIMAVFVILADNPVLGTISMCVFFSIWMYCWWYRKNENPPFKPPGGGTLLFAGAFTDKTRRWNVLVDVAIIAFGLFAASHVLDQNLLNVLFWEMFFFFFLCCLVSPCFT